MTTPHKKALGPDRKAYGLRVLRPGTYVYFFYFQNGRMWTQHYQVTDDVRFARIWWTRADEEDAIPWRLARPETVSAKPYLSAPATKEADVVYLLTSESMHDPCQALERRER